jgi:hypothetical protein
MQWLPEGQAMENQHCHNEENTSANGRIRQALPTRGLEMTIAYGVRRLIWKIKRACRLTVAIFDGLFCLFLVVVGAGVAFAFVLWLWRSLGEVGLPIGMGLLGLAMLVYGLLGIAHNARAICEWFRAMNPN